MRKLRAWLIRATDPLRRKQRERDLAKEIESHMAMQVEAKLLSGLTPAEARRQAAIESGGIEQAKEAYRDQAGLPAWETLLGDIRYGARLLRRSPGFATVAIVTLALGIGANTAVFSIVDAVLLRRLPYPQAARLLLISEALPQSGSMNDSWPDYKDWQKQNHVFDQTAAFQFEGMKIRLSDGPKIIRCAWVTREFFHLAGLEPLLGRGFAGADEQPGRPPHAVVSYAFWRNFLHADGRAIGQTLSLDDQLATISGVLKPAPQAPFLDSLVYLPFGTKANRPEVADRANHPGLGVLARLRPDVSLTQAQAEMRTIMDRLGRAYPASDKGEKAILTPLAQQILGSMRGTLSLLGLAVAAVLMLACANLAHMTLSQAAGRRREFALRAALGARSMRLTRQVLVENVLLAAIGGGAGLLLAALTVPWLVRLYGHHVIGLEEARINPTVLLFTTFACVATAFLFGTAPALLARQTDPLIVIKDSGGTSTGGSAKRLRGVLVVLEVALALVLSLSAGLLLRSFYAASHVNPGFEPEHLLAFDILRNSTPGEQTTEFFRQLVDKTRALPGVASASAAMTGPLGGVTWTSPYSVGHAESPGTGQPWTALNMVLPGYFKTLRAPLLAGRLIDASDTGGSKPVALVNRSMAVRIAPKRSAVGTEIYVRYAAHPLLEVVGVVGDVKQGALDRPDLPEVFVPATQMPVNMFTLVVRVEGNTAAVSKAVLTAVTQFDPGQPVTRVVSLSESVGDGLKDRKFLTMLLGLFGLLALLLAATGISGVAGYAAAQQTREIGIRMALGARGGQILRLVSGSIMQPALGGLVLGLLAFDGCRRLLASSLFGTRFDDPVTLGGVGALLLLIAAIACYLPARRALAGEPLTSLRHE